MNFLNKHNIKKGLIILVILFILIKIIKGIIRILPIFFIGYIGYKSLKFIKSKNKTKQNQREYSVKNSKLYEDVDINNCKVVDVEYEDVINDK